LDLIKERLYYTIGEVSSILNLNPSTIRYWEKQFLMLKPSKRTGTSKRKFDFKDIQTIFKIKSMLKNDKVSIKQARIQLENWKPGTDFENFKKEVEESNRPEVAVSKEKYTKMITLLADIKNLFKKIK